MKTVTSHLPFHTQHSSLYGVNADIHFSSGWTHVWLDTQAQTRTNMLTYTFEDTCLHTHQARAAKIFSDHPSYPFIPPSTTRVKACVCVCVCVYVCVCDRYSLSVRVATKCSDISRLCSPGSVIPPVPLPSLCSPSLLYLWRNASHPIMSNQPHTTSVLLFPSSSLCWHLCVDISVHLGYCWWCITYCRTVICMCRTH